jgi:hypothetical protein
MKKSIKKIVTSHPLLAKLTILLAITGSMIIGPAIFTFIYYIQANKFQEKALQELKIEGKLEKVEETSVLAGVR